METPNFPLFKLFVYSAVDVKDDFEEVNDQKMLFYLVMAWSFSLEAIFVLFLFLRLMSHSRPHWRLFCLKAAIFKIFIF